MEILLKTALTHEVKQQQNTNGLSVVQNPLFPYDP